MYIVLYLDNSEHCVLRILAMDPRSERKNMQALERLRVFGSHLTARGEIVSFCTNGLHFFFPSIRILRLCSTSFIADQFNNFRTNMSEVYYTGEFSGVLL